MNSNDDPTAARMALLEATLGAPTTDDERGLAAAITGWLTTTELQTLADWVQRTRPEPTEAPVPDRHANMARRVAAGLVDALEPVERELGALLAGLLTEPELAALHGYMLRRRGGDQL